MNRFFKPEHARLGDTIPYFHDGTFHVFYLKRYSDDTHDRIETDWWHLTTQDFVSVEEVGVAIPRGGLTDPDHSAATGSVVRVGDEFHAYYTGFSGWQKEHGGRHQTLLRSRSRDLVTWEKDPSFRLVADEERYDAHEWRDPFVFHDADADLYRMFIAGQARDGFANNRGVTVQATSPDGETWTIGDPIWAPELFSMHECPDLFRIGDHWYLVFSTLTDRTVTRYRRSRSLDGPWEAPDDDALDGLGLYAAKSVSDGTTRYLVGWCPNAEHGVDGAPWLWGGNLVVHQLETDDDGWLVVRQSTEARRALEARQDAEPAPFAATEVASPGGFAVTTLGRMPHAGFADVSLTPTPGTKAFGIELRTTEDRSVGYSVTFEPTLGRLVVDRLDRFGAEAPLDVRPWRQRGAAVDLRVEFDGEVTVVYVDDRAAVTFRGYTQVGDGFSVFVRDGTVSVSDGALHSIQQKVEEDR